MRLMLQRVIRVVKQDTADNGRSVWKVYGTYRNDKAITGENDGTPRYRSPPPVKFGIFPVQGNGMRQ
jgi:hypothetical protein